MMPGFQDTPCTFTVTSSVLAELLKHVREQADLEAVQRVLSWDQTQMPRRALPLRSRQLATLEILLHERKSHPALLNALTQAASELSANPDAFTVLDLALVRETQRQVLASGGPPGLFNALAQTRAACMHLWRKAAVARDFRVVAPTFEHLIGLLRQQAQSLAPHSEPYAVLFARFEPDLPLSRCLELHQQVREATCNLLQQTVGEVSEEKEIRGDFAPVQQEALLRRMLGVLGYQLETGRLDLGDSFAEYPCPPYDVRLNITVYPQSLRKTLRVFLHEVGHGLYLQGVDPGLAHTNLADATSYGLNEGQARLWETLIGRSLPFWQGQYPLLQEIFPQPFQHIPVEQFVGTLNQRHVGVLRREADEVSYNLHICIRTELERALINGELSVHDLPQQWAQLYHRYLGVKPAHDDEGVLQDVHWSMGNIGYFPTYLLANLYAAQTLSALQTAFPDLDERLAHGDVRFVGTWLREHLYRWGKVYSAAELCHRLSGEPLTAQHFLDYLTHKFNPGPNGLNISL